MCCMQKTDKLSSGITSWFKSKIDDARRMVEPVTDETLQNQDDDSAHTSDVDIMQAQVRFPQRLDSKVFGVTFS